MIDTKAIEEHIRGILVALGDDPNREGLLDTPKRVAKMYEEVFEGMNYTNREIAEMFNKTFADSVDSNQDMDDMVIVRDIEVFSFCEHHLALMYDMKVTVAYIPKGKVIGLSKIARIADMVAKRLQLQERIGADIAEVMQMVTGSEDVAAWTARPVWLWLWRSTKKKMWWHFRCLMVRNTPAKLRRRRILHNIMGWNI